MNRVTEVHEALIAKFARDRTLSPRQRDILALLTVGERRQVIAGRLGMSPKTFDVQFRRILAAGS